MAGKAGRHGPLAHLHSVLPAHCLLPKRHGTASLRRSRVAQRRAGHLPARRTRSRELPLPTPAVALPLPLLHPSPHPCPSSCPLCLAADYPKDPSKISGGKAGGAASAARPTEERQESARKAAETRRQNQIGPGVPAEAGQPQDYNAELRGATWQVEREGDTEALQENLRAGDEEAEQVERARDRADPDYTGEA
eukprot:scaffold15.g4308.t1